MNREPKQPWKQPSTKELMDHVKRKLAEGSIANHSVLKKVNRQIEREVAEFLASVSKRSRQG